MQELFYYGLLRNPPLCECKKIQVHLRRASAVSMKRIIRSKRPQNQSSARPAIPPRACASVSLTCRRIATREPPVRPRHTAASLPWTTYHFWLENHFWSGRGRVEQDPAQSPQEERRPHQDAHHQAKLARGLTACSKATRTIQLAATPAIRRANLHPVPDPDRLSSLYSLSMLLPVFLLSLGFRLLAGRPCRTRHRSESPSAPRTVFRACTAQPTP